MFRSLVAMMQAVAPESGIYGIQVDLGRACAVGKRRGLGQTGAVGECPVVSPEPDLLVRNGVMIRVYNAGRYRGRCGRITPAGVQFVSAHGRRVNLAQRDQVQLVAARRRDIREGAGLESAALSGYGVMSGIGNVVPEHGFHPFVRQPCRVWLADARFSARTGGGAVRLIPTAPPASSRAIPK